MAESLPLAKEIHLRERIIKLGIFKERTAEWIRKEAKVNPPVDSILLALLFIASAYLPSLVWTILYTCFIKKEKQPTIDPSLFVYNNPDAKEIAVILKTVGQLKEDL